MGIFFHPLLKILNLAFPVLLTFDAIVDERNIDMIQTFARFFWKTHTLIIERKC